MKIKEIIRYIYYYGYYSKFNKCGRGVNLARHGIIVRPEEMSVGDNVYIGPRFMISAWGLTLGSNILIGPNLVIMCENHLFDKVGRPMFDYSLDKNIVGVDIEDDVWIGANVTILKGVTIGEGSVVGACSLLTKSILPYTISFGNPASEVKLRFTPEELKKHLHVVNSSYNLDDLIEQYKGNNLL